MASINLLPWREERRDTLKKGFMSWLLTALILAAIAAVLWTVFVNKQIETQKAKNAYFQANIDEKREQAKELVELKRIRQSLIDRVSVIQDLQGKRPRVVHVFDELTSLIPEGVYLNSFSRTGDVLHLTGNAEANSDVSEFLRKIASSPWYSEPNFKYVKTNDKLQQKQDPKSKARVTRQSDINSNEFSLAINMLSPDKTTLDDAAFGGGFNSTPVVIEGVDVSSGSQNSAPVTNSGSTSTNGADFDQAVNVPPVAEGGLTPVNPKPAMKSPVNTRPDPVKPAPEAPSSEVPASVSEPVVTEKATEKAADKVEQAVTSNVPAVTTPASPTIDSESPVIQQPVVEQIQSGGTATVN